MIGKINGCIHNEIFTLYKINACIVIRLLDNISMLKYFRIACKFQGRRKATCMGGEKRKPVLEKNQRTSFEWREFILAPKGGVGGIFD
jgi:hypothetical protein